MTDAEVLDWIRAEYARPFVGWDFSGMDGRREGGYHSEWDFTSLVDEAVRDCHSVLDQDTGDGRRFAEALGKAGPRRACATEAHAPNVPLARDRLVTVGAEIVHADTRLPFRDASFDLVLNRHGAFDTVEVARVLRPGGRFLTQQVGDRTNLAIHAALGTTKAIDPRSAGNLEAMRREVSAHLRVSRAQEAFTTTRYHDAAILAYYLKAVAWEVPDFSVDRYADQLLALHRRIERDGPFEVGFHLVQLAAEKPP